MDRIRRVTPNKRKRPLRTCKLDPAATWAFKHHKSKSTGQWSLLVTVPGHCQRYIIVSPFRFPMQNEAIKDWILYSINKQAWTSACNQSIIMRTLHNRPEFNGLYYDMLHHINDGIIDSTIDLELATTPGEVRHYQRSLKKAFEALDVSFSFEKIQRSGCCSSLALVSTMVIEAGPRNSVFPRHSSTFQPGILPTIVEVEEFATPSASALGLESEHKADPNKVDPNRKITCAFPFSTRFVRKASSANHLDHAELHDLFSRHGYSAQRTFVQSWSFGCGLGFKIKHVLVVDALDHLAFGIPYINIGLFGSLLGFYAGSKPPW